MDEKEQICFSLITWLKTFSPGAPHDTPEHLSDGVAIAQALSKIAPVYFTQTWLSKIKCDDLSNWRLKVTNLKKILKGILEYTLEVLGVTMQGFQMPDVNAIAEHNSPAELGRLLQLVLNVAINCDNKQEHIQIIMSMEEVVQQSIMNAIQELMNKEAVTGDDGEAELQEQLKKTVEDLNNALMAKDELLQRCHELDTQVASLQEERQSLSTDNEKMLERLLMAENMDDPSTPAGKRCTQLLHQIEALQEELYRLESGKDDYRIKFEVLSKDYNEMKEKNVELSKLASESRAMKDELDILRHTSDQMVKYESAIESYKKRLEELSDLQGQMKLLEEKNTKYMQQQIEMEEELKRVVSLKQQLESYKRQTLETQNKMTDETKRADKAEFEYKRIQDKLAILQREKDRIQSERDSLREMNEELECTQFQGGTGLGMAGELDGMSSATIDNLDMMSLPPKIKEKILRLEHENKKLKMESSVSEESKDTASEEQLDEANAKRNELETEVRLLNQRLMEVQAELEDLQENQRSASAASNSEVVSMRTQLSETKQKLEEKELQVQQKQQHIVDLEAKVSVNTERLSDVNDLLAKKDEEIRLMEEKYRKYLEKAKQVIKSLDPRHSSDSSTEVILKNQLQEKDKYINFLESDQEKNKSLRDQEERLIVTAWYNLGMQLHRQAAEERLANSSMGQSFLARQRQVHSRRANTINSLHNTSPSENQEPVMKRRFSFRRPRAPTLKTAVSPLTVTSHQIPEHQPQTPSRPHSMSVSVIGSIPKDTVPDLLEISPNHFSSGGRPTTK